MTVGPVENFPPNADEEERARWQRLAAAPPWPGVEPLSAEALRCYAKEHGTDDATAALYWRLRQSENNGPLIRAIERNDATAVAVPPHVIVVPGAFHKHHADTGADGRRVLDVAGRLGWSAEVLDVGSLSPMDRNADALIARLIASPYASHVIVSLSKGSADVATAFARPNAGQAMSRVSGWVSLSGLVLGTPLVAWLRSQWWRMPGVRLLLWWMGCRFADVDELRHGPHGRLHAPPVLPSHLRAFHVVGFPCEKHLRHRWAGRAYRRLLPLGPNDGGGILLADVERLPGVVYAAWGVDHYLNPAWDFSPRLATLLRHAAQSDTAASAMPAGKSTK